jgi:serine protease Do
MNHATNRPRSTVLAGRLPALAILLAAFLALAPSTALAQRTPGGRRRGPDPETTKGGDSLKAAFRDVVADASKSTVRVKAGGKDAALGTVVGADGWIVSKASELTGDLVCITYDGTELDASIAGVSEDNDLALLKVDAKDLTPVEWADAGKAQIGQWVAVTAPAADPVAVGVLSVGRRKIPGRSGLLGVLLADGDGGAKVQQVVPDSPAEKAGVKVDDLIVSVNGDPTASREALVNTVHKYPPGHEVVVAVKRGDKTMEMKIKLAGGIGPAARGEAMNQMGGPLSERSYNFPAVLQHDTVLRPDQCGGPLVTLDGKAIGVNIARAGRVESYALPADVVQELLPELKAGKGKPAAKKADGKPVPPAKGDD